MTATGVKRLMTRQVGGSPKVVLAIFSAVHLATGEFVRNAAPSLDITAIPTAVGLKVLLAYQVLPFIMLVAADFAIAARCSQSTLHRFRSIIFALAIVLVLRQVELYFAPAASLAADAKAVSPILSAAGIGAVMAMGVWLAFRMLGGCITFLSYFSPAAFVLLLAMTSSQPSQNESYAGYNFSEAPHAASGRPVFVVVFDELAYEALLDQSGQIDSELYPNFARFSRESLYLTNATSNYFRTWLQVPELIDAVLPLSDRYEVRLYEQTHRIEALYASGCGTQYTCRGLRYFTRQSGDEMATYIGMRTLYHMVPGWLETTAQVPLGFFAKQTGSPPPPSDPIGMHEISTALLDQYLHDISSVEPEGRLFFLHTLLPHYPFVFEEDGEYEVRELRQFPRDPLRPLTEKEFNEIWEHYKVQIQYADAFLGKMFSELEAAGLYDDAIIIITADHGARPLFPKWGDAIPIESITTNVPMFIRAPGITPGRTDVEYQHIDFGATVSDLVGLGFTPSAIDGPTEGLVPISALDPVRPTRPRVFYVDDFPRRFWEYVYRANSDTWEVVQSTEGPIWDRTKLGPEDE